MGDLPSGRYDVFAYIIDPDFSQAANVQILVSDANGTAVNTGVTGDASWPNGDGGAPKVANLTSILVDSKVRSFSITSNGVDPVSIYFDGSASADRETPLAGLALFQGAPSAPSAPTVLNVQHSIVGGSAGVSILFTSTVGKTYTVRTSPDLVNWSQILTSTLASGGATTTFTEASIPLGIAKRFYKISGN